MRGERQLLRIGEYVVGRACRRLPRDIREERYREWAAELPAILHDPQVRPAADFDQATRVKEVAEGAPRASRARRGPRAEAPPLRPHPARLPSAVQV